MTHDGGDGEPIHFERILQLRAHEYVADEIKRRIALRAIRDGESLPSERDLATMFGVGRPTVQLALRLLEAEGLVEARRGRRGGTFVLPRADGGESVSDLALRLLTRQDQIEELLTYRQVLEPQVVRLATTTRTDHDLAAIGAELDAMAQAASEPEYMRHDTAFHVAVARATQNRYLAMSVEQIRVEINDALSLVPEPERWLRRIRGEHEAIHRAVLTGDPDAAEAAAAHHTGIAANDVRTLLASIRRRAGGTAPELPR